MLEPADYYYTSVESGLICNMKLSCKSSNTMQAAAAKEKQDAKTMYSILDNTKTVWSMVNANNEQVHQAKSEHEKILSQAYSANITATAKNLPTSFSSTTVTVTSLATTEKTKTKHSLPSSSLSLTITVTSTITNNKNNSH